MRVWITLTAAALALIAAASAQAQARRCAIGAVEGGAAELWANGAWRAAAAGALPAAEAILRTGPGVRVEIACSDGLVVTVGEATEVALESLTRPAPGSRDVVMQLIVGILGIVAPTRRDRAVELRTPLAIAAARSTEWLAEVAGDGASAVFVRAGVVAVRPADAARRGGATLTAGDGVDVAREGGIGPVVAWGDARAAAAGEALGFGWR